MRERKTTVILAVVLLVLSIVSLFVGVMDITPAALMSGDIEQLEIFLISRLPRLLAILCTGVGMSVAGLIMQQLCMNKFVSPLQEPRFLRHSLEFYWRFYLCRIPHCGAALYLLLHQQFLAHGFLSGLSRGSDLRIQLWFLLWELCSEM